MIGTSSSQAPGDSDLQGILGPFYTKIDLAPPHPSPEPPRAPKQGGGKAKKVADPKPALASTKDDDFEPPETAPEKVAEPEPPKKEKVVLSNPQWEKAKPGFNEETPISVDVLLPEEHAYKTRVTFELFAKTPKGPESICSGEAHAKDGKAICPIPIYIPKYKDEEGNRPRQVEYYFIAKHSEAEPLDSSESPKVVEEMADKVLEMHILQNVTFATGKSFVRTSEANDLKALGQEVKSWKGKHPDGKLAVFGHADAVGEEISNKQLSERRAKAVHAYLAKDPKPWEDLYGQEKWGLASVQELLKYLGHDPGVIDGQDGPKTQAAVKDFQGKQGLGPTGNADAKTREALFLAYFEQAASPESAAKDFDAIDGKAFTGCSEFNLIENTQGACETNRRVAVLLLQVSKNFPINYPCKQGAIGPCQSQTKREGDRRTAGFRCKFYDGLVVEKKGPAPKPVGGAISGLKWETETAWCGDIVKLTAMSNLAEGTEVSIKLATEDQTCEEIKAKIQAGKLEFPWKVHSVAFSFGEDKKAKAEVEVFAEVTAVGKKYNPDITLKVKKLVEAKAEVFDKSYTWGQYSVHSHFTQSIVGNTQKVEVRKKALKSWGATYVDLTEAGIKDIGGGFPWAGKRWARCNEGEMWPLEYWDGKNWKPIPDAAKIDGSKFGTLPLVKKGNKFHWVSSEAAEWPGQIEDYAWEDFAGKRQAWIKDSNKRWTGVHTLKRKGCAAPDDKPCCAYQVSLEFSLDKVDAFAKDVICLAPGSLRSNAGLLFYGDKRLPMAAHEVGHLVGLPDEYDKGAVDSKVNGDGAVNGLDSTTLMGGNLSDPNCQIKVRHYSNFAAMARLLAGKNGGKDEEWIVRKKAAK